MKLIIANTGSYPRAGDSPELQTLRKTIAAVDRGEMTSADLADAENEMTRRAIEEQARAGVELLTDGQIRWHDPISHLAGKLAGVKINGLLRFFDTNTYFRQPVLMGKPERKGPLVVEEYRFACNALGQIPTGREGTVRVAVKQVLTGPYTLAKLSLVEDPAMQPLEARAEAYAAALADEVKALGESGAEFIQVDEPAIIQVPNDWGVFTQALEPLIRARDAVRKAGRKLQLALYAYFHNPAPFYEKLAQLPVDALGLDFTYDATLVDVVAAAGSPRPLGLGLVDGRNTKLESPTEVARVVERLLPKIKGERAYLGPSSGLEYLPRDGAAAKLELLGKIRAAVNG
ncbi:MAG: methylcobamide--CoM methyltransferase [Acidobacteria bacterium]|nr:methylcobamide--CoM methyltransferase [Acidobacteriota bacterium]MBI3661864.1 methylcobamide--CoM methyltransferase [Acidobacteriota bacterium]